MTAATSPRRARPPLLALIVYTLRSCVPGRWVGIAFSVAASVLFGLVAAARDGTAEDAFADVATAGLFGLVLPVACLVIGDAVLGAELRAGSFAFTWLSPVPPWQIAVARWAGGTIVAASISALAFALAAFAAGAPESAGAVAISAAFGAMAYIAVFIAIGCIATRAAVWSLAFVFIVERLLGSQLSAIAQLSPSWEARAAFLGLVGGQEDALRSGVPSGTAALMRLVLITVVVLALSANRIRHLRLTGSSD